MKNKTILFKSFKSKHIKKKEKMGEQLSGRALNYQEIQANGHRIRSISNQHLIRKFREIKQDSDFPRIYDAGIEIEITGKCDAYAGLTPCYSKISQDLEEQIQQGKVCPEIGQWLVEVTSGKDVFMPGSTLDSMQRHVDSIIEPVSRALKSVGGSAVLVGGHPQFTLEKATELLSPQARYKALVDILDPFATPITIPFVNGDEIRRGLLLESYGVSNQQTIKIPHNAVAAFHDAAYITELLFLAGSLSSPFIEGRATTYDSVRSLITPPSTYGFSTDEKRQGRPGRWRSLDPLTLPNKPNKWFDHELYEQLMVHTEPIARYFASVYGDGHLLLQEGDLQNNNTFPSVTNWPRIKIHANGIMDDKGIGLEMRIMEMPAPEDIAPYAIARMAVVEALAHKIYCKQLKPLSAHKIDTNINRLIKQGSNMEKTLYWPTQSSYSLRGLPEIFQDVGKEAFKVLQRYHYSKDDIEEILNPLLRKSGICYDQKTISNQGFRYTTPKLTPAQTMRKIAYQMQPKTKEGEKLNSETTQALLEPLTYK